MNAIFYLYRRSFVNKAKRAFRKPMTYLVLLIIVIYGMAIPVFMEQLGEMGLTTPGGMTAILTVFAFWSIPANLMSYAKRKGLLFKAGDAHFMFASPISPKKILLYAHLKNILTGIIINIIVVIIFTVYFHVELWLMLLYFLFANIIENLLEGSIMVMMYGSEWLREKGRAIIVKGTYILLGSFAVIGIYYYIMHGLSVETVMLFLHSDALQLVPLIGWNIGVLHLLFMGPTLVNVIATILYLALTVVVMIVAIRMKCEGEYYEDAAKFADDYEELIKNRQKGNTEARFGKKAKYKKASVVYKSNYSKAIFYRQLLEYKKSRFFIFDINTVASLIAGLVIAFLFVSEGESFSDFGEFVIPGAMAYLIFIFSNFNGKWAKEITSPYTFLLPDTAFSKLWYATLMQNIGAFINGCIFTLPGAIVMKMSPLTTILCIVLYVALSASRLYTLAVTEALLGNVLGNVGRQLVQLLIQGFVIIIPILGAVAGYVLMNLDMAYILMTLLLLAITLFLMLIASKCFYRMETVE